jgi:hypothetical protein
MKKASSQHRVWLVGPDIKKLSGMQILPALFLTPLYFPTIPEKQPQANVSRDQFTRIRPLLVRHQSNN